MFSASTLPCSESERRRPIRYNRNMHLYLKSASLSLTRHKFLVQTSAYSSVSSPATPECRCPRSACIRRPVPRYRLHPVVSPSFLVLWALVSRLTRRALRGSLRHIKQLQLLVASSVER